jgi:hypothetical protein
MIWDELGWGGMGWNEMGWDEMGWDVMGWDGMGRVEPTCEPMSSRWLPAAKSLSSAAITCVCRAVTAGSRFDRRPFNGARERRGDRRPFNNAREIGIGSEALWRDLSHSRRPRARALGEQVG